jgi:hypothetical protein
VIWADEGARLGRWTILAGAASVVGDGVCCILSLKIAAESVRAAMVLMHYGTQRVSMLPVWSPSSRLPWFLMCNDFASLRGKGYFVVMYHPMEVRSG